MKAEVLVSSRLSGSIGEFEVPQIIINYEDRDRVPDLLEKRAGEHGLTVEQLIKRYINKGLEDMFPRQDVVPGESLEDFLVKNGALKPK